MSLLRGRTILILALIAGLVTAFFARSYMLKLNQAVKPVETVSVLMATRDVPARTRFAEDMFVSRAIPVSAKHPNAITRPDQVLDKVVKLPIIAGEQILGDRFFADRAQSGLAFVVPPGKRAVAVAVSEVIGSGGLIIPGDEVDVVGVFDEKAFGEDAALFVLQKVSVLAVAQQIESGQTSSATKGTTGKPASSPTTGGKATPTPTAAEPKPQPTARTVTVAVQPDEALRLIMAEERGKIRLVLRPADEQSTPDLPPVMLRGLSAVAPSVAPAPNAAGASSAALIDGSGAAR